MFKKEIYTSRRRSVQFGTHCMGYDGIDAFSMEERCITPTQSSQLLRNYLPTCIASCNILCQKHIHCYVYCANIGDFIEEVEAIWCIRRRNLVKLLGYSIEGAKRVLVYEYVNNGNLHQWLHGCIAKVSPLTWDIRMSIILGITKGLVYLHKDSEPVVIHQYLKSLVSYFSITNGIPAFKYLYDKAHKP